MRLPIVLLALLVSTASASPLEPTSSGEPEPDGAPIEVEPAEPSSEKPAGAPIEVEPAQSSALPEPLLVPTPQDKLAEAVLNYQTNKHGLAMQQLAVLSIDPNIDSGVRQDARVYLGEILYIQGDTEAAKQLFEQVLIEDPSYQIDRFRHPPDVCGHFEYVRTYIVPTTTPIPMVIRPMPAAGYAPFASYQFKYSTPKRWPIFIGQVSLGTASIGLFGLLLADRQWDTGDSEKQRRLQTLRVVQYSATAGFYGMWLWSGLDARRHWRINMAVQPAAEELTFIGGATFTR